MTTETLTWIKDFIAGLGFPIFVACYLLIFFRATIQANTEAIQELISYLKAKNGQN